MDTLNAVEAFARSGNTFGRSMKTSRGDVLLVGSTQTPSPIPSSSLKVKEAVERKRRQVADHRDGLPSSRQRANIEKSIPCSLRTVERQGCRKSWVKRFRRFFSSTNIEAGAADLMRRNKCSAWVDYPTDRFSMLRATRGVVGGKGAVIMSARIYTGPREISHVIRADPDPDGT